MEGSPDIPENTFSEVQETGVEGQGDFVGTPPPPSQHPDANAPKNLNETDGREIKGAKNEHASKLNDHRDRQLAPQNKDNTEVVSHAEALHSNSFDESETKPSNTEKAEKPASEGRITRKRKAKESKDQPLSTRVNGVPLLIAVDKRGRKFTVKMILAHQPYVPSNETTDSSTPEHLVGHDGNQYYCQVCRGFGDVVCCDACPRVYHQACVPLESPSRNSLENDDDPWYCPECIAGHQLGESGRKRRKVVRAQEGGDRRATSQNRCSDCEQTRQDLSLAPCEGCGAYVHSPSCQTKVSVETSSNLKHGFCMNCQAIDHDESDKEETDKMESVEVYQEEEEEDGQKHSQDGSDGEMYVEEGDGKKKRTKRKGVHSTKSKDLEKKKKKKKKRKKKRSLSVDNSGDDRTKRQQESEQDRTNVAPRKTGMVQATPAFVFYLAEARWKIEKALVRKHRTFNRLPKGEERNALVATEAMEWWSELPENERSKFIEMSMRDFEARIIQWKEAKVAKEMQAMVDPNASDDGSRDIEVNGESSQTSDDALKYEKHERLYLSTSVGSKPFKLEPDQSYNRVLLDLLHDSRFHPLPMFCVNRAENDNAVDEQSNKVTIPFFEVHGPISTSIGDECLGCSRGWAHFCPVLQRRVPAVEHRAKLQPPMSSLLATRIGLGLRPKSKFATKGLPSDDSSEHAELFTTRDSDVAHQIQRLPLVQNSTVSDPDERGDDIVQFIEETVAMKIPEPPRPVFPDAKSQTKKSSRALPTSRTRTVAEEGNGDHTTIYNKCGRCRTIIFNDTGCVQCRRAQLVINKSKKIASATAKGEGKTLKIHTTMLSRVQMKERGVDRISKQDAATADAILKMRWCPSAILPPQTMYVPKPRDRHMAPESTDDDASDDEVESEILGDVEGEEKDKDSVEIDSTAMTTPPLLSSKPEAEDKSSERQGKRARSTRKSLTKEPSAPDFDRQTMLKHHKKDATELQKKMVQIACDSILLALIRRDPLHLFARPVKAEGYSAAIRNPIDFGKIKENVLASQYTSLNSFCSDARLLCENALAYNPPSSIYFKTAKEMHNVLATMQKRASEWMNAIKNAHANYLHEKDFLKQTTSSESSAAEPEEDDPFQKLRKTWPEAVAMLENGDIFHKRVQADFVRTKENETAFYGTLAVRRVAMATEASLAPYTDSAGLHTVVNKRTHLEDAKLRNHVDTKVAALEYPHLQSVSAWREEAVVRLVRKVQKLRVERKTGSEHGCSRCDGAVVNKEAKAAAMNADLVQPLRPKRKGDNDSSRVNESRVILATGLGSAKTCQRIVNRTKQDLTERLDSVGDACVSVRGSKVHGMGLFADQPFVKGDVVAEYIGEYVANPVADQREKVYGDQRIQDYQFRLDDKYVIDATLKGGAGRYINHNCTPNCRTKIIPGEPPEEHLRRVMIIAQRSVDINEEISYDYQFPLEMDLSSRIPCNCQSDACRGFMNWDLPEKGSNNRALLVQKRGANMRDRIRRLNRPLKRDEVD